MGASVYIVYVVTAACLAHTAAALKCYQCVSNKQTDICYTMERSHVTLRPTTCVEVNYDRKYTFCYKKLKRDKDGNFQSIDRGCAYTKSDHTCALGTDWAQWPKLPQCEVQACPVDACNSAWKAGFSLATLLGLVVRCL